MFFFSNLFGSNELFDLRSAVLPLTPPLLKEVDPVPIFSNVLLIRRPPTEDEVFFSPKLTSAVVGEIGFSLYQYKWLIKRDK